MFWVDRRDDIYMKNISEITRAMKEVSKQYPIKKVQLFGSYADNNVTENSDIDLLVEFDRGYD